MKRPLYLVCLVLAASLILGCPKPWILTLYNNTGEDLVLVLPHRDRELPAGSKVELTGSAATKRSDLHWELDEHGNEVPVLKIRRKGAVSNYRGVDYRGLSDDYVDYGGPAIRQKLQLESDGSLYVIPPSSPLPAQPLPQGQPPGFPLTAASQ